MSDLKYIKLSPGELDTYRLFPGDILFNRTNSKELVGKCEVFRESGEWVFASYLIRVRANPNFLLPQFASDFMGSNIGQLQIDSISRQIIGMTNINAEEIRGLRIPLPPISEQEKLVAAMDAARAERKAKLSEADALLAGVDDFVLNSLGLTPPPTDTRRVFSIRAKELESGFQLSPSRYVPELRKYLNGLRAGSTDTKPLSTYVDINPAMDTSGIGEDTHVGFIPMQAVSDGATGEYQALSRRYRDLKNNYTPFVNGDILWAKITPCMQNGKCCIVDELPNGMGFGSTEFHVLRVRSPEVSKEFVMEFVSQATLRRVATNAFTGSAGQQRVPATFLENLPFPNISKEEQEKIVVAIQDARIEARRLRSEAEAGWQAAKQWFEGQLLGSGE